jgi:hypothetical protein
MDRAWIDWLIEDAQRVELRIQTPTGFKSRILADAGALSGTIRQISDEYTCYTTLNRPRPSVASGSTTALRDVDIDVITRIVFDLDPVRPTGVPSTDAEVQAALKVRDDLVALLHGFGWPMPALGMSGNGAHAVYRTRIKSTPDWRQLSARLYLGLRDRLSESCAEAGVHFDSTVRNAARIWRIYGTVNHKGPATPERPHRLAQVVLPSAGWQPVKADTINRTAAALTPVVQERTRPAPVPFSGHGDYRTLDIVGWFEAHGHYRRALGDGKHAVRCPWEHEHSTRSHATDSSTVIWKTGDSGWPTFHCSHSHCDGRQLADVMALWGDVDAHCAQEWRRHHG